MDKKNPKGSEADFKAAFKNTVPWSEDEPLTDEQKRYADTYLGMRTENDGSPVTAEHQVANAPPDAEESAATHYESTTEDN